MERATRALWRKELWELSRGWVFWVALGLLAAVTFTGLQVAAHRHREEQRLVQELATANGTRLQQAKTWRELAGETFLLFAPQSAAARLVQLASWPAYAARPQELPTPLPLAQELPPSPVQLLLFFVPLFMLVGCFDAVVGEKTRRTLPLLLGVVGSRKTLVAAKMAVRAGGLATVATLGVACGLLASLPWTAPLLGDPSFLPTCLVLLLATFLLALVFGLAAVGLSVWAEQPTQALFAGLLAYVLTTLVLPQGLASVARLAAPWPSPAALEEQSGRLLAELYRQEGEERLQVVRRWMSGGPDLQRWAQEELGRLQRHYADAVSHGLGQLAERFFLQEHRARTAAKALTALLPGELFARAVTAAAGLDEEALLGYRLQVLHYTR
ncbi:MAG: ABC transporter permease, partial [Thermoanaerobaculum sp.]|nr:ABC transporter permease [Thermoanaerobaculum sp.]